MSGVLAEIRWIRSPNKSKRGEMITTTLESIECRVSDGFSAARLVPTIRTFVIKGAYVFYIHIGCEFRQNGEIQGYVHGLRSSIASFNCCSNDGRNQNLEAS